MNNSRFYGIIKAIGSLKNHSRLGWLIEGVPKAIAEDVAQHSFEASIYALILGYELKKKGIEVKMDKLLAMTLLHDIAEAYVGDIVKFLKDRIGKLKEETELEAVEKNIRIDYIVKLYEEYIKNNSVEAKIVRLADLLATYIQSKRYYKQGYRDVERILNNTYEEIIRTVTKDLPYLKDIVLEVIMSISD